MRVIECEFSGYYKPTPLKMNLVLEIRLVPKRMGKLFSQGIFSFPGCFCFGISIPLNMINSDCCRSSSLGDCV
jgi:hypothetical protein